MVEGSNKSGADEEAKDRTRDKKLKKGGGQFIPLETVYFSITDWSVKIQYPILQPLAPGHLNPRRHRINPH